MRSLRMAALALRLLEAQGPVAFLRMSAHQLRRRMARMRPRHAFLREHPPTGDLVGMTTPEEQSFLYDFARRVYTGRGEIVDLGCWLGSTTIPLAAGLAENAVVAADRVAIHAYDLFRWETWMEKHLAGSSLAGSQRPGESFQPLFERLLGAHRSRVRITAADLTRADWQPRREIELLFNDAAKSWELANALLRTFYVHLVPGLSLVVEQDFAHHFTPWVHLLHWRLRDHFEPLLHVPYSGSMSFRLVRPLAGALPSRDLGFSDFGEDEVAAAFERSLALVEPPMRPSVWASRVMVEVHQQRFDRARELLAEAPRRGYRGLDLAKISLPAS